MSRSIEHTLLVKRSSILVSTIQQIKTLQIEFNIDFFFIAIKYEPHVSDWASDETDDGDPLRCRSVARRKQATKAMSGDF